MQFEYLLVQFNAIWISNVYWYKLIEYSRGTCLIWGCRSTFFTSMGNFLMWGCLKITENVKNNSSIVNFIFSIAIINLLIEFSNCFKASTAQSSWYLYTFFLVTEFIPNQLEVKRHFTYVSSPQWQVLKYKLKIINYMII